MEASRRVGFGEQVEAEWGIGDGEWGKGGKRSVQRGYQVYRNPVFFTM
jgi:hypothetical protein